MKKINNLGDLKNIKIYFFAVLIIFRIILSNRLPCYLLPEMPHDDGWMLARAQSILKGEWLGSYDHFTLIKGMFSPILLALSSSIGLTFSGLNTVIYCLACIVFVKAIRPIIKNNVLQILCLGILLFNPISYALETGQRAYRCGIGQWEIIIIFAGIIAIFLRRNDNWISFLKWAFMSGTTLGAFLLTREDGVWIYPFVVTAVCLISILIIRANNNYKKKIAAVLLILAMPILCRAAVTLSNYIYYGAPVVNDRTDGFYAKVAGDLNAIIPNAEDDKLYRSDALKGYYITIYVSTMEKAIAASPTLHSVGNHLRDAMQNWVKISSACFGLSPEIGQPATDHMLWALRDGVMSAGHYNSLQESEAFFEKVHKELQMSFKNGTLGKRGLLISPLIAPLQKGDLLKSLRLMPIALLQIVEFKNVSSAVTPSVGSDLSLKKFGLLAGKDYLLPSSEQEVKFYKKLVGRANFVIKLYKYFISPAFTIVSFIAYLIATYLLISGIYKKTELKISSAWLIMSGLLFTLLLFLFCMCIITTTTFDSLNYLYCAPAYILLLMFCVFSVCWGVEAILDYRKRGIL